MRQSETSTAISGPASIDATASTIEGGRAYWTDMARRLAPDVARAQSRARVRAYRRGLLSEAERQHRWQVADVCGEPTPSGCQDVLSRADGAANAGRDARRTDSRQHLGDSNGGWVLAEMGFLKQGQQSAGVARQDTGTVGQVASCHLGVLMGDASRLGHALGDRELYVPAAWAQNRERCRQAGIPGDQPGATTPQLACQLLARAFAAGLPATGVTGDRGDGADRRLRLWVAARPQAYVLAVSGTEEVWRGPPPRQVNTLLARLPAAGWRRLSAGDGAKGRRWYAWRGQPLALPLVPGWGRWRLVRRCLSAPTDLTAYGVFAPPATSLEAVVRVAGRRWTVESGVAEATGEVGREHDAVRSWTGWSRHLTLALWALALLTVMRAGTMAGEACKKRRQPHPEASPLAAFKARRGLASR